METDFTIQTIDLHARLAGVSEEDRTLITGLCANLDNLEPWPDNEKGLKALLRLLNAMSAKGSGAWWSIKDKAPSESGKYLIFAPSADPKKPLINTAWYTPGAERPWTMIAEPWQDAITHWQPLPEWDEEMAITQKQPREDVPSVGWNDPKSTPLAEFRR